VTSGALSGYQNNVHVLRNWVRYEDSDIYEGYGYQGRQIAHLYYTCLWNRLTPLPRVPHRQPFALKSMPSSLGYVGLHSNFRFS
jgi:hypothetical protein